MTSPFDDPEIREQMARMGVGHKPGMAADMMQQIAPLLAAEGIDMDDPDTVPDLDTINAALDRATAQHNFMLSTPIGTPRAQALALLRDVALALSDEAAERAESALATIEPEPSGNEPSVAHVIGVALGLVDTWHSDPTISRHVARTRVPRWPNGRSQKAATDILALAKKGRAFDSMGGLIGRHFGLHVFEGASLAVAGSVIAWAASEGIEPEALLDRIVSDTSYRAPSGSSFRRPSAASTSAHDDVQREFRTWLEDAAPDIGAPSVEIEAQLFDFLQRMAAALQLDIADPNDAMELFDEFLESADDFPLDESLLTMHDYVQFQLEVSDDPDAWEELAIAVENELDDAAPALDVIRDAVEAESEISEADLRRAIEGTRIVSAVGPLLEWLGKGRTATAAGNVRRADIETIAGMLGISAVGVSKSVPLSDDDRAQIAARLEPTKHSVLSLAELPIVSDWWEALLVSEIVTVTGARMKPGPAAAAWADGTVELADLQMFVGIFIGEVVRESNSLSRFGFARSAMIMAGLQVAISADAATDDPLPIEEDVLAEILSESAQRTLSRLVRLGIGEADADGTVSIPPELRGTVARGMLVAMAIMRASFE